jgi:hypothetical protein
MPACPSVQAERVTAARVHARATGKTTDLVTCRHRRGVERVGWSMFAALGSTGPCAIENLRLDDRAALSVRRLLHDRCPGDFEHLRRWHRRPAGSRGRWRRDRTALRVLPIDGDQHLHPSHRDGALPHGEWGRRHALPSLRRWATWGLRASTRSGRRDDVGVQRRSRGDVVRPRPNVDHGRGLDLGDLVR